MITKKITLKFVHMIKVYQQNSCKIDSVRVIDNSHK